ncbi:polycystic kidney disease protein 1-like 2 isoform X2 [Pomacea canaliculata]|uniref:polycystic kidney disease protein 1-like 2 isoform X2 n=1 Tax=Pomacea canaliculata TaxID=400727 RepID=UPI000D7296FB|nr:polycystic kidney disease protein 1-like 2 isoform X2 [Pomacea canaliculata]
MNCGRKVAISTSLVLSVTCGNCSDESMADAEYRWTLYLIDSDTGQQTEVQNAKQGQTDKQGIVIKEKTLKSCQKYRMEANMMLKDTAGGFAVREFLTNCPPWGGNCTVKPLKGNVLSVNETFKMSCSDWQDEGFEDDANSTDESQLLSSPLTYKFFLRKNETIFPIAEGGEGKMPPTTLPIIADDGSTEYELVARIYDPLHDFTEYSVPIELVLEESESSLKDAFEFWERQTNYSDASSTLTKQMRGITIAGAILANYSVSDNQTELQQAFESKSENGKPVVSMDWDNLWNELKHPPDSPSQKNLTEVTDKFTNLVHKRGEEAKNLTGLGLTALAHGLSTVLSRPETVSSDSVKVTTNITDMAVEALRKLYSTKPYPIAENLKQPVVALASLVDRLVTASVPSYEVMRNMEIVFNASDLAIEDRMFLKERLKVAAARKNNFKAELIKEVMPQLETTLDAMTETLLVGMVVGQEPERAERGGLSLMACKTTGETLTSTDLEVDPNNVALKIHDLSQEDGEDTKHAQLDVKANVFTKNPYPSSDLSSHDITSPVVKLDVRGKNGTVRVNKLTVTIKRGSKIDIPTMETFSSNDTREGPDNLLYHRLPLLSPHSAIITYIKLPPDMEAVTAYFRLGKAPTLQRYDVKTEGEKLLSIGRRDVDPGQSQSRTMFKFVVPAGVFKEGKIVIGFLVDGDNNDTYTYEYLSFTDSCRVWDEENRHWSPACKISDSSSPEKTVCECENPPGMTFASSFLVPPTTIDFRLAFSKFDVNNAWVYGTMIGLLLVWVLGVLWARRQDKADRERWQVGFLTDNVVGNSYFYLLTVHTGLKRGSGTKSNISFVITGSQTDSGVRGLTDGKRSQTAGSVMSYIMATSTCLGDLDYMRVWHDNSGGYQAAWYLSRVDVEDLQTGQRYIFVCERWFAIDKDDGLVDRLVPLAQQDEVMSFDNLFSEFTKLGLTDTHLWFSCLLRPAPSAFTRVQRLSCCVVLLLLTMITSAMFFKPEDNETGASTNSIGLEVKVGIMRFSATTLWTSFVSILITSIPTMLFVIMFRYSRPRPGPRARATTRHVNDNSGASNTGEGLEQENKRRQEEKSVTDLAESKLQENPLPYYCRYVTWLLLLTTAAMCAFFLVMYSMQWGKTTSAEWLTSFVASFFESIFVLDPIKVLILALLLAFCAQNPYMNTPNKEHVDLHHVHEEVKMFGVEAPGLPAIPPDPVPQKVLLKARRRREQEQTSQRVFFELLLYTFFVFCIFCLSYANRDENSNRMYQHLSGSYFDKKRDKYAPKDKPYLFVDVKGFNDVIKWLNVTAKPTLFPREDAQFLQMDERVFTSDPNTFRIGPLRVRQLRMPIMQRSVSERMGSRDYVPPYKWEEEERGRFCVGWKSLTCSYDDLETRLSRAAWTYQTLSDVSVLPVWGEYSTYSSGGYIMDFSVNWDVMTDTLQELQDGAWLDNQTRAVFVEFSLYNPDSNLLAYMRLVAEFPETGDTLVWKDIKILRIYQHLQPAGAYVFIGEIIALIAVFILTIVIIVRMKKQKLSFFRNFWQVLDACTVTCSYFAMTFYALKSLKVDASMAAWRENRKVYVDFYQAAFWDALYGYMLAAAVFITTLRLLRVLGYNKRLTAIGTVLSMSGRDLLGFSVVFLVVFVAYMSAGYLMFLTSQRDFRSPWNCALALYQILLGRSVLSIISEDGALYAWIYFISFIVLVFLILMTMFQAIVCNASSIVHADLKTVPPPYGLTNLFVKFYHSAIVDWLPSWLLDCKARAVYISPDHRGSAGTEMTQPSRRQTEQQDKREHESLPPAGEGAAAPVLRHTIDQAQEV